MNHFYGKSYLKEIDFNKKELEYLVDFALHLKDLKKKNVPHKYLENKNIALLFEKTSTRTRSAFTVAANDLGAHPEFMGISDTQFGYKESVADSAKILGSMFDGIEFRGFEQATVEVFVRDRVPIARPGQKNLEKHALLSAENRLVRALCLIISRRPGLSLNGGRNRPRHPDNCCQSKRYSTNLQTHDRRQTSLRDCIIRHRP